MAFAVETERGGRNTLEMQENAPKFARGVAREEISVVCNGAQCAISANRYGKSPGSNQIRAPLPAPSHREGDCACEPAAVRTSSHALVNFPRACGLSAALLLSGCAMDVANRYYAAERFPAKDVSQVELLFRAPSRKFTAIADFQSRGESPESMRKRAAGIGADAVIVTPLGGLYAPSEQWAGNDRMSRTYSRIVGTAIKYTP